jgi:predicted lipoprotein
LIADHKLPRPLGGSVAEAKPHLAEAWRSGRSLRNIVINLKAAQDLYAKVFSPVVPDRDLDDAIVDTFRRALEAASGINEPLEKAVEDKAMRGKVEGLATQILALKTLLLQKLPGNVELQVGFNALDGD